MALRDDDGNSLHSTAVHDHRLPRPWIKLGPGRCRPNVRITPECGRVVDINGRLKSAMSRHPLRAATWFRFHPGSMPCAWNIGNAIGPVRNSINSLATARPSSETFYKCGHRSHRTVPNRDGCRCCHFNPLMSPPVCQATASSRRSSPQNTSPRVTNVGTPKMFSLRASSVAASYAPPMVSDRANGTTRAGSCPISTRLSERFGSPPASVPSTNQRRYVART